MAPLSAFGFFFSLICLAQSQSHQPYYGSTFGGRNSDSVILNDGTSIFYKDWNQPGVQPILFTHDWPQNADQWDAQLLFFGNAGYRVIAPDRRGYGRSTQTWGGNDIDTWADDLRQLIEFLDLKNLILVGHSAGAGEIAHYIGRFGSNRVARVILVSTVTPHLVQSANSANGVSLATFDAQRKSISVDRSDFFHGDGDSQYAVQYFSHNYPIVYAYNGYNNVPTYPSGPATKGLMDNFWRMAMQGGVQSQHAGIRVFTETDFTADLKKIDRPTLVLHAGDDQIAPLAASGQPTAALIPGATLKVYPYYSHAMLQKHPDEVNADILAWIEQ